MYLLDRDVPVRYHYPPFVRLGHGVCSMEALIFMHDRILNYRLQGITRSWRINYLVVKRVIIGSSLFSWLNRTINKIIQVQSKQFFFCVDLKYRIFESISVSGQLPTYPSPNPTLTLTCYINYCYLSIDCCWARGGVDGQLSRYWYWYEFFKRAFWNSNNASKQEDTQKSS